MAYIKPAVQVYQELVTSGGAQQLNPDMPACIIGPLKRVIEIDFVDPLVQAQSVGNIRNAADDGWINAEISTLENEILVFINQASASPGQRVDVASYNVWMTNPLILNYQTQLAADYTGVEIILPASTVGLGGARVNTPLPYRTTENHVALGDTVTFFAQDGTRKTSTYVTDINTTTNTITINDSTTVVSTDIIRIYRKFGNLKMNEYTTEVNSTYNSTAVKIGAAFNIGAFEYNSDITNGYTAHPEVEVEEGGTDNATLYIGYVADRADTASQILTINDVTDLQNKLGVISVDNPLAYGVNLALANSGGTAIYAIALDPNLGQIAAHTKATELAQAQRLYALVPMTQNLALHGIYKAHVNAMSLPESSNWRVAMTNCALPTENYILGRPGTSDGSDDDTWPDGLVIGTAAGTGTSRTISLPRGVDVGTTTAGDNIHFVVIGEDEFLEPVYTYTDATVSAASGSAITCDFTTDPGTEFNGEHGFYVGRPATKQNQAQWVSDQAKTWVDKRMWMFPGEVYIPGANNLNDLLPGYYLMCALAGFISGTPAQQPITNIAIAGVADLQHGNFYFTEAQMNLMAEFGTLLYAQNNQGTTPYCRHGLTTDVSTLEYREVLKVKNWDYMSYYYKDILNPFIGTWNITPETLQTIRQTVTSASETLLTRRLPKIGPPLLSYDITTLEQSATSADAIELIMQIAIVNPNNYTNVHLQI